MNSPLLAQRDRTAGFTLLELLITIVIVGILASIAYPSFIDSIRKSRRSDGIAALTQIRHAQERFRANNPTYAGTLDNTGLNLSDTSPDGHYTMAVSGNTTKAYVATATAKSGSPQISDLVCRVLKLELNDANGVMAESSANSGGTVTTGPNNPCWVK